MKEAKSARHHMLIKNEGKIVEYRIFTITKDIPYSDTFNVEEHWVVVSTHENAQKCILRQSNATIWLKSSILKSKIISSSMQ